MIPAFGPASFFGAMAFSFLDVATLWADRSFLGAPAMAAV